MPQAPQVSHGASSIWSSTVALVVTAGVGDGEAEGLGAGVGVGTTLADVEALLPPQDASVRVRIVKATNVSARIRERA